MEAVLPLKCNWRGGDFERAQFLFRSLSYFWADSSEFTLHVVVPSEDMERVAQAVSVLNLKISVNVHDENNIIPGITGLNASGWLKQQAIKLKAYTLVSEDFYLCLDSDIICCQKMTESSFFLEGRALTDWSGRRGFPEWWLRSAEILGAEVDLSLLGMGVTPEFFSVDVARALDTELASRLGPNHWGRLLLAPEYFDKTPEGRFIRIHPPYHAGTG